MRDPFEINKARVPDVGIVRMRTNRMDPHARTISARHKGEQIGAMAVFRGKSPAIRTKETAKKLGVSRQLKHGEILTIGVAPEFRRKGVATLMFRRAQEAGFKPKHSGVLSDDGRAWSKVTKMRVPEVGIVRMRTRVTPKAKPDIWGMGTVEARHKGKTIGYLNTHQRMYPEERGFITGVSVGGPYRRKGIARRMLQTSERVGHKPMHSGVFTVDGEKWANAVGGRFYRGGGSKEVAKALPRGAGRDERMAYYGRVLARNISRSKQNPPTQGPFELPRQLPLYDVRNGKITTNYNARRRKP